LTARGRYDVVRRVVRDGETCAQAAAGANVAVSTVHAWVTRWRRASAAERASLACLADRSSRPHRSPTRVPAEEERRICELRERTGWSPRRLADEPEIARSHSTVHRVLQRAGVSRRPRPERPAVVRYLWPCPGQLLHMDTKKLGKFEQPGHAITGDRARRSRRVGWEYVHSIIDDCSRLAYSEIADDETAVTVTAFTERALDFFLDHGIVAERLMTDNAFAYIHNRGLRELLDRRAIRHIRTRPYTPRTNGKVERYQQTLQREWAYALEYASSQARRASLPHWVRHYNERRTHSALGNRPPIERVREVTGLDI
jgi:transposase InsO family protein